MHRLMTCKLIILAFRAVLCAILFWCSNCHFLFAVRHCHSCLVFQLPFPFCCSSLSFLLWCAISFLLFGFAIPALVYQLPFPFCCSS